MNNTMKKGIKAKIIEICKKSDLLCRIYEFNPRFTRFCRFGTIAPATYVINHEKKLIYVRMCKVANSSIKGAMCEEIDEYHDLHRKVPGSEVLTKEEKEYFKFSFVRNPYERLVSCYVNKYVTPKKKFAGQKQELYMDKYLFGYIRNPKDFSEFVKKVCKIPPRLEEQHFQQQYHLLYDRHGNCLVDYVGNYENIQEDFECIRQKFNLKPLPHYNKSEKGNWMDYYTLETAELVYKKYKKDFETFGYNDLYHELVEYLKSKNVE